MKRLVVGNWKMNLGPSEASILVHRLQEKIEPHPEVEVVICPPFIDIFPLNKEIDRKKLRLGAQNIYDAEKGAFTGEISAAMLRGLVDYAIIGHSERRAMGEDDKFIARKVASALRNDITPILCVGETLADHEHGLTSKVVVDQLTANLAQLTAEDIAGMVIAYEPIWAIGSGIPATPEKILPAIRAIRSTVEELYGETAAGVRVLYGGSVTADFAKDILAIPGIVGLLVGGASLKYEEFASIIKATAEVN